jgi:hypothetical protein
VTLRTVRTLVHGGDRHVVARRRTARRLVLQRRRRRQAIRKLVREPEVCAKKVREVVEAAATETATRWVDRGSQRRERIDELVMVGKPEPPARARRTPVEFAIVGIVRVEVHEVAEGWLRRDTQTLCKCRTHFYTRALAMSSPGR